MSTAFSADKNPETAQYKKTQAPDLQAQVQELQSRLNQMALTITALWELLAEKTSLSQAQLLERIEDLDMQSGFMDGTLSPPQRQCQQCHKPIKQRQMRCSYCEIFTPIQLPLDALW